MQYSLHILFSILVPGCDKTALVGNGLCNDETNNADCNYDGGDCCAINANQTTCFDCACHTIETCVAGYHPLVVNGFCNDETNIVECDYDGGDCCGYNINSEHCTECNCFHQETCLAGLTLAFVGDGVCNDETNISECEYDGFDCCPNLHMVGDGICNDESNQPGCNHDGGDCCVNVNTDSCSECNCLVSGYITSPGFPENYANNLDLTWLIQVKILYILSWL